MIECMPSFYIISITDGNLTVAILPTLARLLIVLFCAIILYIDD